MTALCNIGIPILTLISVFSVANMYGIEVPADKIIFVIVSAVLVLPMLPVIPGVPFIVMSSFFVMTGCPAEAIALIMAIDPIAEMVVTLLNVTGIIGATAVIAKWEKYIDLKKYKEN